MINTSLHTLPIFLFTLVAGFSPHSLAEVSASLDREQISITDTARLIIKSDNPNSGAQSEDRDFLCMKSSVVEGHGVQCVSDDSYSDRALVRRSVDSALLNLKLQQINRGTMAVSKNKIHQFYALEQKKLVLKDYYDCKVFDEAIKAAPSLFETAHIKKPTGRLGLDNLLHKNKEEHCDDNYKSSLDNFKDLSQKVRYFSKENEDLRKRLTEEEYDNNTYSGVGQFRDNRFWNDYDPKDERVLPGNALSVSCPDGVNNVVITPAHAFRDSRKKKLVADMKLGEFGYSEKFKRHKIAKAKFGGWPSEHKTRDWAVVKLKTPLKKTKALVIDPRANKNYTGCVDFVAWRLDVSRYSGMRKQRCKIKSKIKISDPGHGDYSSGVDMVRHNCYTKNGASGGALIACDTGKLVGMHIGWYGVVGTKHGVPYSEDYNRENFNRATLLSGRFLSAINKMCAE